MMTTRDAQSDAGDGSVLDAYLDGSLRADETGAFEQRLAADPATRREIGLQRGVDESLKRMFAPPDVEGLLRGIEKRRRTGSETGAPSARVIRLRRPAAIAAALLLAGAGLWRFGLLAPDAAHDGETVSARRASGFDVIYREVDLAGRVPLWVCETEAEFIGTFVKRLGFGMALSPPPPGVKALGLSYSSAISDDTVLLLAEIGDDLAIVLIDRLDRDADFTLPPNAKLRLHRKTVGPAVLYEVSPLEIPHLLDLFKQAPAPTEDN